MHRICETNSNLSSNRRATSGSNAARLSSPNALYKEAPECVLKLSVMPVERSEPGVAGLCDYARNDEVEDPTLGKELI